MKKEFTISYISEWDKNGTHYNQRINITTKTLDKLKDILQAESVNPRFYKDDKVKRTYLFQSFGIIENGNIFINLTQRDFFQRFIYSKLNLKRFLNRNTYFHLINN